MEVAKGEVERIVLVGYQLEIFPEVAKVAADTHNIYVTEESERDVRLVLPMELDVRECGLCTIPDGGEF